MLSSTSYLSADTRRKPNHQQSDNGERDKAYLFLNHNLVGDSVCSACQRSGKDVLEGKKSPFIEVQPDRATNRAARKRLRVKGFTKRAVRKGPRGKGRAKSAARKGLRKKGCAKTAAQNGLHEKGRRKRAARKGLCEKGSREQGCVNPPCQPHVQDHFLNFCVVASPKGKPALLREAARATETPLRGNMFS